MSGWALFWTATFVGAVLLFLVVEVVVVVGGAGDIKEMLQALRREARAQDESREN
ncbi:MAG: hypothetical protein GKR89_02705 [Candidatus Latescibacteria bacterium]|nr:hypothetical protein [Candidatus Latescibacterota bacterium]